METATFLVALGVSVLAGTAIARRLDFPPPLFLVVAGFGASYLPGVPEVHLEAEVVLLGLLPPLLYAVAISTSLVDFNANRRPILLLSVGLVVFTTVGVALLTHELIPGLGWPAAFAIGAVVAPPDAVAATAIGRRIGLPATDRDDPRGRVAAQRRHRPGGVADRHRGRRRRGRT